MGGKGHSVPEVSLWGKGHSVPEVSLWGKGHSVPEVSLWGGGHSAETWLMGYTYYCSIFLCLVVVS